MRTMRRCRRVCESTGKGKKSYHTSRTVSASSFDIHDSPPAGDLVRPPHPLRLRSPLRELASSRSIFFYHALLIDPTRLCGGWVVNRFSNCSSNFFPAGARILDELVAMLSSGFPYFRRAVSSGRRWHDSAPVGSDYQTQGHFIDKRQSILVNHVVCKRAISCHRAEWWWTLNQVLICL
jgi:hypothetical protein